MADAAPLDDNQPAKANTDWLAELRQAEAIRWAGHQFDEDGFHDEEACELCLLANAPTCTCRCGQCCHLLIEVSLKDAEREPKIAKRGSPMYLSPEETASGQRVLAGYLLNSAEADYACAFLDQTTNLCTIYDTRPLVCRLFDCDAAGHEQLVELGILPARPQGGEE